MPQPEQRIPSPLTPPFPPTVYQHNKQEEHIRDTKPAMVRCCSTSLVLGAAAVAALLSTTSAQFNPECGLGETPLYIQVHGTDKLTECTDYFDDVDPYAVVTVGQDRLGVSKVTKTIDNEAEPTWDQVLSHGCVEENTKIFFRVRDQDYFGDEACLGPLSLPAGPWPKSGKPQVICTSSTPGTTVAGTPGKGCISFTLYYGAALPPTIVTSDGTTTITTAAGNTTAPTRPSTTPSLPSTLPSKPDTPSSPTPSVVKRPANATSTPQGESSDPSIPPTPRAPSRPPSPITPYTPSSNGTSTRPSLPQGPRNASQPTAAAPAAPPVIQAPSPIAARTEEEKEKEHERQSANTKKKKGAALAGGIVALLAFAGIGVGVLVSRRRRMREEQHGQQLELDEEGGMRRGTAGDTTPGSVAVL